MSHTPGPWAIESLHNADMLGKAQWRITAGDRERVYRVADVYPDLPQDFKAKSPDACLDECAADARLIAAAPELLAALLNYMAAFGQGLEAHGIPYGTQQTEADIAARAAIAKAEGK